MYIEVFLFIFVAMSLKLFEIKVDNDPGGWKSGGSGDVYLIIAESEEESKVLVQINIILLKVNHISENTKYLKFKIMQCETFSHIDTDTMGKVMKPKKAFKTHDAAIKACKELNIRPHNIHKLVSYKCNVCFKYHIGRNGKELTEKYRNKLARRK